MKADPDETPEDRVRRMVREQQGRVGQFFYGPECPVPPTMTFHDTTNDRPFTFAHMTELLADMDERQKRRDKAFVKALLDAGFVVSTSPFTPGLGLAILPESFNEVLKEVLALKNKEAGGPKRDAIPNWDS